MHKSESMITQEHVNKISYEILGCAIRLHKALGPGLLESVYKACFVKELEKAGLRYQTELRVPVIWEGTILETEYRLDVLVEELIVVELKSIENIMPVHMSQLLTYMKLIEKPKGLLINFYCVNIFKEGQKSLVNEYFAALPKN